MAWKIEIDGVDQTTSILQPAFISIAFQLNGRSRARFVTTDGYSPDRFDPVLIYEQDGVTVIFGGFILQRHLRGLGFGSDPAVTECEAVGLDAYLDWALLTLSWATDPTLQEVLDDVIAALPASYGITLDATDYTGITLAAFSWTNVRASDALRELCDRCGFVYTMSPTGVLSLALPGGTPAPETITDADTHCRELTWSDGVEPPVTTIILLCGGTGTATKTQDFLGNDRIDDPGGEYSYFVVDYDVPGDINLPWPNLLEMVGSGHRGPVSWGFTPGEHFWQLSWDYLNHRVVWDRTLLGDVDNAWTMSVTFTAQYPFTVTATSSPPGVPEVMRMFERPEIFDRAQGQEVADGLLAQYGGDAAREVEIESLTLGWMPGQEVSVTLVARAMTAVCAITAVEITLQTETYWLYRITATELTIYDGGYLAAWRALLGAGFGAGAVGSATSVSVLTGMPPIHYLGGSRFHAVQVPA